MNNVSCSVNNNPLAQLNNKFTNDSQLNNNTTNIRPNAQRFTSSSSLQSHEMVFKTNQNVLSDKSKNSINHFVNSNPSQFNLPSPNSTTSLQMGIDKRPMMLRQSSALANSAIVNNSNNHLHPTFSPVNDSSLLSSPSSNSLHLLSHTQQQQQNLNDWSTEFNYKNSMNQSNVSMVSINQQQQGPQSMHIPHFYNNIHSTQSNNIIRSNQSLYHPSQSHIFTNQQQQQQQQQTSDQFADTNWDEKFNDLEKEVSEVLNLNDNYDKIKEEIEIDDPIQEQQDELDKTKDNNLDNEIVIDNNYQAEFQEVWDSIHHDAEDIMPNANSNDYIRGQTFFNTRTELGNIKYDFENSKNEYLNNPNAYEIGCILMENGAKLSEAAMAFEAAVQENPRHVQAWLKLGLVQIQNEKEINGISALETCLKLDPKNLEAMKNLAISYINEGYDSSSFTILNKWIETKYPNLDTSLPNDNMIEDDSNSSSRSVNLNEKITKRFLKLANQLPQVDPDVQLCLGLLFYASDDFDKTIDCFKSALMVNPNDELMWNRLGAALANSDRSEESIKAYHRALQLKPSFVRARYNLAVSSMNINCYKEAAEHLLASLSMHEVEGLSSSQRKHAYDSFNNDNILETLKRAFVAMDRQDLLEKVQPGMDLNQFRNEFSF